MIRLLALDLDGTLLTDEKTISAHNKDVLMRCKKAGIKVVITTGRPLKAIAPYVAALELNAADDYAITFNGGLVQQITTGAILGKIDLHPGDIADVYDAFKKVDLPLSVLSNEMVYELPTSTTHPSIYSELNPALTYDNRDLNALPTTRIFNKMVSATDETYLDAQIKKLPAELADHFEIMKSRKVSLEILPKGVSKAAGLAVLGEKLGIAQDEMMSFGDEANDLSMIEWCGVGVAMGNSSQVILDAADFISTTNQADGVAYAIEQLIFKEGN